MKVLSENSTSGGYRIVISAVLASVSFVCQIMEMSSIVSLCFALSIALVFSNFVFSTLSTNRISPDIILLLIVILFPFLWSGIQLNFEVYKRAIIVLCCIFCINSTNATRLTFRQFKIIECSLCAASAYAIYMYYWGGLNVNEAGKDSLITMNFSNPNACGMWLTTLFIALFLFVWTDKNKFIKLVILLMAFMLFPIIHATDSRNSILSCALLIFALIVTKVFHIKKIPRIVLLGVTVLPILVFFFYMYIMVPSVEFFSELFSFMIEEGKSITSRQRIWQLVIDDIGECFIFGNYNYYQGEQMHNSLMTIFCMFGAPCTFFVCRIFYLSMKKKNLLSQIALSSLWFTGCFEASFFVGVAGLYLMLEVLPAITNAVTPKCYNNERRLL